MDENKNEEQNSELLRKNSTILDLLKHEVTTTIGADRVLKRIEKIILQPEILKNLSFEQLMLYQDKMMRRQKEGREFIIDFYRVTSKSQDIQNVLKHTITANQNGQVINGEVITIESENEIRNKLLAKLDIILKAQEKEEAENL